MSEVEEHRHNESNTDRTSQQEKRTPRARNIVVLVFVGLLAGVLSGMFGIGGGSIIVPALVWVGYTQRNAAATSLAAIIPLSISGVASYAINGNVDWLAALLMVCGTIVGSLIGSWLLSRLPELLLRWVYVIFLAFVMVSQIVLVPSRNSTIHMTLVKGISLVVLGMLIGMLSALLGVGGGAVAVPALSLIFGASDLIARGTSLLAMFPSSITGTISNWKRGLVNLGTGLLIGVAAAVATPLGSQIAAMVTARMGSYLLAAYLFIVLLRCTWTALKITPGVGPKLPRK